MRPHLIDSCKIDRAQHTKNRMSARVSLSSSTIARIPPQFLPLFDRREFNEMEHEGEACAQLDGPAPSRLEMFVAELPDDYESECERNFPTPRAALSALKHALQNPLCTPHADKLISELHHLKLTVSMANRRVAPNSRPTMRSVRRSGVDLSADERLKIMDLERTLSILRRRVAALALIDAQDEERSGAL